MTNLESLLREWAVLEPDWCELEVIQHGYVRFYFQSADVFVYGGDIEMYQDDTDSDLLLPLRQAIETRGWSWATGCKGEQYYGRVMGNEIEGERPVEALLAAYLKEVENDKP